MSAKPLGRQAYRYLLVTGLSAVTTVALPTFLHEILGIEEEIAVAIALVIAFCINFLMARSYIYESDGHLGGQALKFLATSGLFRLAEYAGFLVLHTWLGVVYWIALIVVLVVSSVLKFFAYRVFVFS